MWCDKKSHVVKTIHLNEISVYVWQDGVVTAYLPQFTRYDTIEQGMEAFYPMADSPFSNFQITDFLRNAKVYLESTKTVMFLV